MQKTKIYWICQVVGWSLYAAVNSALLYSDSSGEFNWFNHFLIPVSSSAFYFLTTHFFRNHIKKHGWLKIVISKLVPRVLLALAILSFVTELFSILVLVVYSLFSDIVGFQDIFRPAELLLNFLLVYLVHLFWTLIYFLFHYVENYNTNLKFEAAVNEIRLNKLKSQLNPHFIFNALNSVRALVDEDPSRAKVAITSLSNILRNSLIMDKKKLINFSDEMKTVRDYLELEGIRFEERLQTELDIHPESDRFNVPPLMIQTLVENGIKHGISNLVEGGWIKMRTDVVENRLIIQIRNSGQYMNGIVMKHAGYGIANTKERIKLIFGKEASFDIYNEDENFVLTEVKIPQSI